MKRMFIALAAAVAASTAFAAPASADTAADVDAKAATCYYWESATQCASRILRRTVSIDPCASGEAITTCAERVGRTTLNNAITTAFRTVNDAGYTIGTVIVTVDQTADWAMAVAEGGCEVVFPTCVALL
jgi:hypothetical protein